LDAIQQWDMAIAKFAYADFIAFIECVENDVLLLAVTVWMQGLGVHKSNILHGVTNIFNIYSNICNIDSYFVYKLSIKWIDNFRHRIRNRTRRDTLLMLGGSADIGLHTPARAAAMFLGSIVWVFYQCEIGTVFNNTFTTTFKNTFKKWQSLIPITQNDKTIKALFSLTINISMQQKHDRNT
jgi:hypothetical protein